MTDRVCLIRHREYGEMALRREAEVLRDAGYEVHVLCLGEPGADRRSDEHGVVVHRVPLRRERAGTARYLRDYGAFFVLAASLVTLLHLRHRFSIVQVTTMPDFLVFCAVIPKLMGARVIVFMKEPTPELGGMRFGNRRWPALLARVEQAAIRFADLALTVTGQLRQRYIERGADPDKIRVVLNGPGASTFGEPVAPGSRASRPPGEGSSQETFTLLCHGAIEERYGHETVVRAVALAAREVPGLRFRITGEGTATERVRRVADELGVADRVELLGWVSLAELVAEIDAADVGVVAQLSSPYSNLVHTNKMYEYILFGTPVVATRLEAVAAYFDDRSLAFVEPGDPHDLARVIVELAHDPGRRRDLADRALELYREYGWERQARRYLEAYEEVATR
jgi:glycosyltransferase involved in cell wall biosynthesis